MKLEKHFKKRLDEFNIPKNPRCLIALSGGGDSVALLELLIREREKLNLKLHAARVMHGIREMSVEEEENRLCEELCREREVPFSVLDASAEIHSLEEKLGCGPEQAARTARHEILEKFSEKMNSDAVFFGHTADDQLETVMMRLLSGSGPEGLKGISGCGGKNFRPLLAVERKDLRRFLMDNGIRWAEDTTNDGSRYTRNRIRNELLPLITDIYPGWPSALRILSERATEVTEALEKAMKVVLPQAERDDLPIWECKVWDEAPAYFRALAIWKAVNHFDDSVVPDRRYPWKTVKAIRKALESNGLWESKGIVAERTEEFLQFGKADESFEARLILTQEEAKAGFQTIMRGRTICISPDKPERGDFSTLEITERDVWPLEIHFTGESGNIFKIKSIITEKSSVPMFTDADKEIFYISY